MADLINVSLCVSDIPRDKIFVAKKRQEVHFDMRFGASPAGSVREYALRIHPSEQRGTRTKRRAHVCRPRQVGYLRPAEPTPDQVSDLPVADNTDDLPF